MAKLSLPKSVITAPFYKTALLLAGCFLSFGLVTGAEARTTQCAANAEYVGPPFRRALDVPFPSKTPLTFDMSFEEPIIANFESRWTENLANTGATAAAITIVQLPPDGSTEPSRSWSKETGLKKGPRAFWWASSGKIVTAAVMLQLVNDDRISLETTIDNWFPDFPNADVITINQLLRHTSGAFTFDNDVKLRGRADYLTPQELIAASARQGSDFCPGSNWLYSNTGYVMLAQIAEQIEGIPFEEVVQRRIAGSLGLTSMRVLLVETDAATVVAPKGHPFGTIPAFATIAGAGPVVANTRDMAVLLHAWLNGDLIGTEARDRAISNMAPMFSSSASYGQGIMAINVPEQSLPTMWIGHLGGSPDAKAVLIYDVRRKAYASLALNTNANGEALAVQLLEALD